MVFVSPSYLFRLFKKKMGVTPMRYRNLVRIDKAKLLLLDRTLTIEEVAERVGFEDAKYFARVFKKETGASPSAFRTRNGHAESALRGARAAPSGRRGPAAGRLVFTHVYPLATPLGSFDADQPVVLAARRRP